MLVNFQYKLQHTVNSKILPYEEIYLQHKVLKMDKFGKHGTFYE